MTEAQIDYIFWRCIDIINYICKATGLSYELLLYILFIVIGQPALILLFYILWRFERGRRRVNGDSNIYLGIYLCYNTASWIYY